MYFFQKNQAYSLFLNNEIWATVELQSFKV